MQWANANGVVLIPKDGPQTCHHYFDLPLPRRGWLPHFDTPMRIILMGAWRILPPRRILHAPGAISFHGGVSLGEPRTRALRSGAKCSSDLPPWGKTEIWYNGIGFIIGVDLRRWLLSAVLESPWRAVHRRLVLQFWALVKWRSLCPGTPIDIFK